MELDNILFGCAIVIAFALPVFYFIASKKKAMEQVKKSLNAVLTPLGITVGELEILGEKAIGISDQKTHFFYYQNNKNQSQPVVLELSKFANCKAVSSFSRTGNPGLESSVIQKIELIFEAKNKGVDTQAITLFDMFTDLQIQGELQLAENWRKKIHDLL